METWKHLDVLADLALQILDDLPAIEEFARAEIGERFFVGSGRGPIGHAIQRLLVGRIFREEIGVEEQNALLLQHIE